jgi:hypothetical protein
MLERNGLKKFSQTIPLEGNVLPKVGQYTLMEWNLLRKVIDDFQVLVLSCGIYVLPNSI